MYGFESRRDHQDLGRPPWVLYMHKESQISVFSTLPITLCVIGSTSLIKLVQIGGGRTFVLLNPVRSSSIHGKTHCTALSTLFGAITMLMLLAAPAPCTTQEEAVTLLVSTTSANNGWAVNYPKQRKVFRMSGLIWVFYSDGAHAVFRTSADGVKWSAPTMFGEGGHFGHRFGGWFDGVYFHYALCTSALGADVYYRRGKPNHDGTMAWSAPVQAVHDTPRDMNVLYPKIIVDANGYPWISFMQLVYQVPNTPPYYAIVLKAATNDGTWTTAADFPFTLVHKPVEGYPDPVGAPLSNGKTLWFYNTYIDDQYVYASRCWNGTAWEDEEVVVNPGSPYSFFNAVGDGDDVHVVHGAGTIFYQKKTHNATWSQPFPVASNASGHTSITRVGPDHVIVTWLDLSNNSVQFRELAAGTWGNAVILVDESAEPLADPANGINMNTIVNSSEHFIHAVAYTTGDASPFRLKFAAVTDADRASNSETAIEAETHTDGGPPGGFSLAQNYPNPFNSETVIAFTLPIEGKVELSLYNLDGQHVATLARGSRQAGSHTVRWDGRDDQGQRLASGVYLYRMKSESRWTETWKLLLLR
jgi:hypothetical protein